MMHGFDGFGTFGWIGMVLNLVVTIGVLVGIVWLVVWLVRKGIPASQVHSLASHVGPKEILQIRYVRGEITREQYHQMLEDLGLI